MSFELPLYRQEKDNSCALACLRMVLAARGVFVPESELEAHVRMEPKGTPIEELERLARQYHLVAGIRDMTVEEMRRVLEEGNLPIAFIDRSVFDLNPRQRARHSIRDAIIHTVVPTRITAKSVTFHDPRPPQITRKSIGHFRQAYEGLGGRSIICSKPGEAESVDRG